MFLDRQVFDLKLMRPQARGVWLVNKIAFKATVSQINLPTPRSNGTVFCETEVTLTGDHYGPQVFDLDINANVRGYDAGMLLNIDIWSGDRTERLKGERILKDLERLLREWAKEDIHPGQRTAIIHALNPLPDDQLVRFRRAVRAALQEPDRIADRETTIEKMQRLGLPLA